MIAVYAEEEFARESSCFLHSFYKFSKEPRKRERAFIHVIVNLYSRKEFLHLIHCRPFSGQYSAKLVGFHDECNRVFPLKGRHENLVIVFDNKYGFLRGRADCRYVVKLCYRNRREGHGCL